ncbi:MAG: TolC family protein [Flavobacteriaceae bacterium]|jgi:outer membrane protein|nr:TolC family protein [Flavobacteriaceae bacterium]MDA9124444.1 TolC family protein [bacterium]MBT4313068.1 TolC family protein [Flavobacteriaceae bacterium]MBT5090879.1 TolC family protein [Flavobacteriaceae bacterium]MBT5282796.1 TolC family protein [Flavobacteriaceae bacterium]|tara:strand:- start:14045 stop:15454 length:1410 start_codon:yes stop_codon:yes gene_type:complete
MKIFATLLLSLTTLILSGQTKAYTLEECVLLALDKNISIKQSEIEIESAAIDRADAIGGFLPRISAQSQHIWNNGLSQNITNGLIENLTTQFSSFGGNIGLTIFNGNQNINQLSRANLNLISRQYQLDDMKDDISLFVANAYLQVMFNRELEQVQRYQLEITKEDLKRTQIRIDAGVLTQADIFEIEANLASQEQALVQAENNYRLSLISLAQLLLITDYENFEIADEDFEIPFSDILSQKPKDIYEKALTIRNDIKLGVANIEVAKKDISLAKGALMPSLTAFYNYNTRISYSDRFIQTGNLIESPIGFVKGTGESVVTQFSEREIAKPLSFGTQFGQNDGQSYGLSLNIPIFNGSSVRNNIKRRELNLRRVENQFEQTKLDLENTVNQAFLNTQGAIKFYEASEKTLRAREEAFQIAQNRFEAGVMNSFDFIQAKQRYQISASDIVRAKFDYIFKLKVLEFYFGLKL